MNLVQITAMAGWRLLEQLECLPHALKRYALNIDVACVHPIRMMDEAARISTSANARAHVCSSMWTDNPEVAGVNWTLLIKRHSNADNV